MTCEFLAHLLRDLAELTNRIFCNFQNEVLINMVLSYDESYCSERISHSFLICFSKIRQIRQADKTAFRKAPFEDVESLLKKNKEIYDSERNYGAKVDILRYEIIYNKGGIYIDADSIALKPFDANFKHSFLTFLSMEWCLECMFWISKALEFLASCDWIFRDPLLQRSKHHTQDWSTVSYYLLNQIQW